jgi:hypothetical protein
MNDLESFDADLEMFRETTRPVNFGHLRFLRWLSECGRLEHAPLGPPSGEFAAEYRAAWLIRPEGQTDGPTLGLEEIDRYDAA